MYIFLAIFVIVILLAIFLLIKFKKKKYKIPSSKKQYFNKILNKITSGMHYKEQITDIDKLYHKILLEGGYEGSFGEILKKEPTEIGDLQKIWDFHKIRNKLVHDFDLLSDRALKAKSMEYKNEVKSLLKSF